MGRQKNISREDIDKRIELTRTLLNKRWQKWKIKKAIIKKWGVTPRTCENYLASARVGLVEQASAPTHDHTADAYGFYLSVVQDKTASTANKIKAQNSIDKLLGLEAPKRVQVSGDSDEAAVRVVLTMPDNGRDPNIRKRHGNITERSTNGNGNGRSH